MSYNEKSGAGVLGSSSSATSPGGEESALSEESDLSETTVQPQQAAVIPGVDAVEQATSCCSQIFAFWHKHKRIHTGGLSQPFLQQRDGNEIDAHVAEKDDVLNQIARGPQDKNVVNACTAENPFLQLIFTHPGGHKFTLQRGELFPNRRLRKLPFVIMFGLITAYGIYCVTYSYRQYPDKALGIQTAKENGVEIDLLLPRVSNESASTVLAGEYIDLVSLVKIIAHVLKKIDSLAELIAMNMVSGIQSIVLIGVEAYERNKANGRKPPFFVSAAKATALHHDGSLREIAGSAGIAVLTSAGYVSSQYTGRLGRILALPATSDCIKDIAPNIPAVVGHTVCRLKDQTAALKDLFFKDAIPTLGMIGLAALCLAIIYSCISWCKQSSDSRQEKAYGKNALRDVP